MNFRKRENKRAFTIVELLTVMSIITILIGLLVPGLNRVRKFARNVRQKAQFHSIEVGLDMFYTEMQEYPESDAMDSLDKKYCGAMKLAEAMMGQDLLGFHPDSVFRLDGFDATGNNDLYPPSTIGTQAYVMNLRSRMEVGLQLENANAYRIGNVYDKNVGKGWGLFTGEELVLCDVYSKNVHKDFTVGSNTYSGTGKKIGMPILYYRAHESRTIHDPNDAGGVAGVNMCIYNYQDNDDLVNLGMPWDPTYAHPINGAGGGTSDGGTADYENFYAMILNENISDKNKPLSKKPYRSDSYILISAGFDGEYGTEDDIFNFDQ
ncbi:MAG TPA: type II secretion system protein [Sedimentisphaerales bacterium]|nr:type II secretion system protein [Sedimentisphaerales bacterium]